MSHSQVRVKSFSEIIAEVRDRIEINCIAERDKGIAEELCLMIAEVECMPSDALMRIGGNDLPAALVKDVYARLRNGHVRAVIENFGKVTYPIRHKKTYFRTALYNRVFEQESGEINDFNSSFIGGI